MKTTRIAIVANSRKLSGVCLAGKEFLPGNRFGRWIRPVGSMRTGELHSFDFSGNPPEVGAILEIGLTDPAPHFFQTENRHFDRNVPWKQIDELDWSDLEAMRDDIPSLWINGHHSTSGENDRVPEELVRDHIRTSLALIRPDWAYINEEWVCYEEREKTILRATFSHRNQSYCLRVTDGNQERFSELINAGRVDDIYLCISLGLPFYGYCYKLVSGVLW